MRKFLSLPSQKPLVRGTDPAPDPSIINQKKYKKNFISTVFLYLYDFYLEE